MNYSFDSSRIKEDGRTADLSTYYNNFAKRCEYKEFDVK